MKKGVLIILVSTAISHVLMQVRVVCGQIILNKKSYFASKEIISVVIILLLDGETF